MPLQRLQPLLPGGVVGEVGVGAPPPMGAGEGAREAGPEKGGGAEQDHPERWVSGHHLLKHVCSGGAIPV